MHARSIVQPKGSGRYGRGHGREIHQGKVAINTGLRASKIASLSTWDKRHLAAKAT